MIADVFLERSTYALPPGKFEAGTPAITQAIGLGAAADYLSAFGMANVEKYEHELAAHLYSRRGHRCRYGDLIGLRSTDPSVQVARNAGAAHLRT